MMKNNFTSIKSHKKLYKAGKTWVVATLLTVGLAGGAMLSGTTNVHADTTTTVQAQQAANPELANAQSDAQKQQSTIDNANAQLKDQQGQLNAAQGQQSSAQQALDQAKQAQQAATANDPAVKKAQADVEQAQQQVNNQKTVVDEAQTAVDNSQQNVESAANAVSQASQKVDQARQAAKDAINKAADQRTSEAQNTINSLESQGKSQASQNLANQIKSVSGQVSDAQSNVNNTSSQISDLQNQIKKLQDQENQGNTDPNIVHLNGQTVDTSKSLLENAARNNLWQKTTYVSDGDWDGKFIPENIFVTPDDNTEDFSAANDGYYPKARLLSEWKLYNTLAYKTDIVNKQSGMTDAQKEELAILLMNQINHARVQRGLKPFVMTEQKYQQAQVRAKLSASNWQHDQNDILTAFGRDQHENLATFNTETAKLQWSWSSKKALDNGEEPIDYFAGTYDNDPLTMLAILSDAEEPMNDMLNNDGAHGGHRENFLFDTGDQCWDAAFGFAPYADPDTGALRYALTFDYDGTAADDNDTTPNMMDRIAQYQAMGPTTGDGQTVDNSAKINDLNSQISNLQSTLASQNSKLQNLQTQLQNLQAQKADVQFDLSQLSADQQAEYNKAKNTLNTVNDWKNDQLANVDSNASVQDALNKATTAQKALTSVKDTQAQSVANLQQAKDGLAELNQVLAAKQAALNAAEQNANASASQAVKDAQAKLNKINGQIADLNKAIETTKATIKSATDQLNADNKKIDDIKNGQKSVDPNKGKGDDKPTNPTTPTKPDDGKKDDNKGTDKPVSPTTPTDPSKGDDHKDNNKPVEPTTPTTPSDDHKGSETPTTPAKPTDGNQDIATPTQPTKPAKSAADNASINAQAGAKSGAVDTNTNKPTVVLPTAGSEGASNTAVQSETATMTREQYKTQQGKLPQTGNENSSALVALGALAGMFGLGLVAKKKQH